MSKDDGKIIIHKMASLPLELPAPSALVTPEEAAKIEGAIRNSCAFTDAGALLVEREGLSKILQTDATGIRQFAARNGKDAVRQEQKVFYPSEKVQEDLSRRIQQPRDSQERENLKQSEAYLMAARDHSSLEKLRALEESRNVRKLPGVKKKVRRESTHCLSGEILEKGAHIHHVVRVEDDPTKTIRRANLVALNPPHHDDVHRNEALGASALNAFAEKRGWVGRVPEDD